MDSSVAIITGRAITRQDLAAIVKLNEIVYGPEDVAPIEAVETIHRINPEICIALKEAAGRIIGYISALPLAPAAFARILDPRSAEQIHPDDILTYPARGETAHLHHLYIASVVVHPRYQSAGYFRRLYTALLDFLLELGRRNILFAEIAARATPQGKKICLALGMEYRDIATRNEEIYHLQMLPCHLKDRSKKGKELIRFYDERYRVLGLSGERPERA